MDITIVIPLKDEAESLPELTQWIARVMQDNHFSYEVIMVDDGSTDDSWKVISEISNNDKRYKGIKFKRNYGKSAALNVAFREAEGDVVITMDADLQDSPDEIPALFKKIKEENFDLVSGWKKKRYDNVLTKNIPSKFFNAVTRKMSGIQLNDFNCGLKAYKNEVVKGIEVYGEMHRYIPVLAKWQGYTRIGEKEVEHRARKYGTTKFGWERFVNGFLDLATIMFIGKFRKKPMQFFGLLGIFAFMIGFITSAYLIISKIIDFDYGITSRPAFYISLTSMVIGTQLFLAGFISEMISRGAPDRNNYNIETEIGFNK
ncbi:MAG: glycosyltransferase family 2 protein [Bacteroidota bacterium]|jgi:glycosyltransferase involved in cell wall biosynthesis|nr:glycosyltransferase family 2 protein [Chitinophagaceae bacterium]